MAPHSSSNIRWFERLSNQGASLQLYCFPYGGGNANVFREWQRHLGADVELCLVHLPGRAQRIGEPPYRRLKPLVEHLTDAFLRDSHSSFAFYGHSMGALLAFELARELRRRNHLLPAHLFLSGCRAPVAMTAVPPVFNLPVQDFIAEIRKLNGTPKDFFEHPELQRLFLPSLRADFEITDTYGYAPEPPLACSMNVYGGEADELVALRNLEPWRTETSAQYSLRIYPGGHFFIHTHKVEFLLQLRQDLSRANLSKLHCY